MGRIKYLVDTLIEQRANGDSFLELDIRMKLLLKGINSETITEETPDDPEAIEKIYAMAEKFNLQIDNLKKTK